MSGSRMFGKLCFTRLYSYNMYSVRSKLNKLVTPISFRVLCEQTEVKIKQPPPAEKQYKYTKRKPLANASRTQHYFNAEVSTFNSMLNQKQLVEMIQTARSGESLLQLLGNDNTQVFIDQRASPNLLVAWLNQLRSLILEEEVTLEEIEIVKKDESFQKLLQRLDEKILGLKAYHVIEALRCLFDIFPEDNFIIESLENHLRWLLRRMFLDNLYHAIVMHEKHQETGLRKDMYKLLLSVAEKRWAELQDPNDVIRLMYELKTDDISESYVVKLEDKALDLCGQMTMKNLYRLIYSQAKRKRRNTPLIRGAMYYLGCQPQIGLSPVHLMNLLYALTNFKLYHPVLFEKIASSVIEQIDTFEPHVASSIVTSVGLAKFRHPKLLDTFTEYFTDKLETVSPKELSTLFITFGILNYSPQTLSQYLPGFLKKLEPLQTDDKKLWLDVVWSLAVLNRLTGDLAESVLRPEFYSEFSEWNQIRASPCHLKLANISALARCDLSCYDGLQLPDDYLVSKEIQLPNRSERPFHNEVLETLLNIAPGEKYAGTNTLSACGSVVDVELTLNDQGSPQSIAEFKPVAGSDGLDSTSLPPNLQRIALRICDFQDMTTYTMVSNGINQVTSRLLQQAGYSVIEISYCEFPRKDTVVNKVAFIQKKLKEGLAKASGRT